MDKTLLEQLLETELTDVRDNWKGICPFHFESTPSFFIHREDLIGHCFGCGIAGMVDTLVARKQEISTSRARSLLGLSVTDLIKVERYEYKAPEIYPESWIHGWKRLKSHPSLDKRGINEIAHFRARWDNNWKRVVFPLFHRGNLFGAAGRTTIDDYPKWYFYWGCNKSSHCFGSVSRRKTIVCEGIFDCIRFYQAGFENSVALLGSEPSKAQIRELREAEQVIIALDNDAAGNKGSEILEKALRGSCNLMYASFPTNDIADLTENQVKDMMSTLITPLEKKLHGSYQSN